MRLGAGRRGYLLAQFGGIEAGTRTAKESKEKTERELLDRLKKLYEEGRKKDPEVFKDDIRLSPSKGTDNLNAYEPQLTDE